MTTWNHWTHQHEHSPPPDSGAGPMSRRLKITLPDALANQLEELARDTGEPAARLAGLMVRDGLANTPHQQARKGPTEPTASYATVDDEQFEERARWLEPYGGDREWSMLMWGAICAPSPRSTQEGMVEKRDARRDSLRARHLASRNR